MARRLSGSRFCLAAGFLLLTAPAARAQGGDAGASAARVPAPGGTSEAAAAHTTAPAARAQGVDGGASGAPGAAAAPSPAGPGEALAARGLVLVPSPGWTPEALEDLAAGLDALPPAARAFPGGPLEVELHPEAMPFGLGAAHQPLLTGALARLHLSSYRDDDADAPALAHLAGLSPDARRRLWRRRAVVHAVVRRWDERLRWSARAGWRRLAGWSGDRPLLVYPWAFSRRAGRASPALDLATFAEELLVPAEALAGGAVRPDDRVRCREPSKARFLDGRLAALDATWRPSRACPAFDAWADVARVRGFEVVFAAPSAASSQALFGHLLLRVVREGDEAAAGDGQVMQLAALVSPLEPRASYVWRGLTGGFQGVFALTTVADVRHEALGLQQRTLRRFALELTEEQRLRLLARLWELERLGYLDYRFFSANCATMLRFLLEPVLDERAPGPPPTPWETPTQVLDALAPLLRPAGADEASGEVARRARDELRRRLSEPPPGAREALGAAWEEVRRLDGAAPAERARAYRALATPLPAALEDWRAGLAVASLRRERFAFDVASADRLRAERGTILPGWKGPTTDELVAARQRRFEQEPSPSMRARAELAELLALDELLRGAPRREFDAWERAALEAEAGARLAFEAAAAAVASLPEAALARAVDEERAAQRALESETTARAVPEGGHGHGFLGVGAQSTGAALLRLRAAAVAEELGDQRLGGFGAHVGVRLLDASLELAATPGATVQRAGFTALGVRAVGERFGWGAGLDYLFAGGAHEVAATAEGLVVLAADARLTHFLLAAAGLRAGLHVEGLAGGVVAPRVGLSARLQLPGSFGNAVRLDAAWTPRLLAGPGAATFEHGAWGRAGVTLRLGVVAGVALSARADAEVEWRPGAPPLALGVVGLTLD